MEFQNVSMASLSCIDAPHKIDSAEIGRKLKPVLSQMGTNEHIIRYLAGIEKRRFWDKGVQPSEVATMAGAEAIRKAGIDKDRIGLLINSSVCKDFIEPSVAALVHGNLGLSPHCMNFDVGSACLGFLDAMLLAGNMIESGMVEYALIVDGEGSRDIVDNTVNRLLSANGSAVNEFRDNFATLTLGSGAAGAVLCHRDLAPDGHAFNGGLTYAATEHNRLCLGQRDGMVTDSNGLMLAGLDTAAKCYDLLMNEYGWKDKEVDEIVIHQVSRVNTTRLVKELGLDESKLFLTYPEYGNIGPAAIPITLYKAHEAGRLKKGDRIVLMGMASGINCSMMEMIW